MTMALNTSIRTVTCYLQSGVCWHRLVAGCWEYLDDFSRYTHTLTQASIRAQSWGCRILPILAISGHFLLTKKRKVFEDFGVWDAFVSCKVNSGEKLFPDPGRKLHPQFQCSNQAHGRCNTHTHTHTHTHTTLTVDIFMQVHTHTHTHTHTSQHSTQALSISGPTIGSLC